MGRMRHIMSLCAGLAAPLVLAAVAPSIARAGTVTAAPASLLVPGHLTYTALSGERNVVRVEKIPGGLRLRDEGAQVIPKTSSCHMIPGSIHVAECFAKGLAEANLNLGDKDDAVTGTAVASVISAGTAMTS
jgi:hypothetical protein